MRLDNMRGLDLNVFDFDYDLTWVALFMDAEGNVLGRFGGRDADTPGKYHSLKGLRFALEQHLQRQRQPAMAVEKRKPLYPEDYAAACKLPPQGCIHCHHINEFRFADSQARKTWKREDVWIYPEPANLGLTLNPDQGNRVIAITERPLTGAALKPGDLLLDIGDQRIASIADVQFALQQAPAEGNLVLRWRRDGREMAQKIHLPKGWRQTDVSWRWSLKSLKPDPCVSGYDLSAEEKKTLGLEAGQLAFRQGPFIHPVARQAGLRSNDIILGIQGKELPLTARQFEIYVRLNYSGGSVLELIVLRGKEKLQIPIRLPE